MHQFKQAVESAESPFAINYLTQSTVDRRISTSRRRFHLHIERPPGNILPQLSGTWSTFISKLVKVRFASHIHCTNPIWTHHQFFPSEPLSTCPVRRHSDNQNHVVCSSTQNKSCWHIWSHGTVIGQPIGPTGIWNNSSHRMVYLKRTSDF